MLGFEERLVGNMEEFRSLENEVLEPGLSKDELMEHLRWRSYKNAAIMADNNAIIDIQLRPLLEDAQGMSDRTADDLFALTQRLYTIAKNLDMGLALTIHEHLLRRAKARGDVDRIVRHLYWSGLIKTQLHPTLFNDEVIALFTEGAEYKQRYFTIEKPETRMYVNRCIGNAYAYLSTKRNRRKTTQEKMAIAPPFFKRVDEAQAFWTDEKVRKKDPDFPWDAYLMNSHQNICAWMDVLRTSQEPDAALAQRVRESYLFLARREEAHVATRFWHKNRMEYMRITSDYYVGLSDEEQTARDLMSIFHAVDEGDYSISGLYAMMTVPVVALEFYKKNLSAQEYDKKRMAVINRVFRYCKNMPSGQDRQSVNDFLGPFGLECISSGQSQDYLELLLQFTSLSHLSTYVHSLQVSAIVGILADYFISRREELLPGLVGTDWEITALARKAGLCHDIGKISYANTVALSSRRIYDFEFSMIKEHVEVGQALPGDDQTTVCIRDVICGHHRGYDGSRGYSEKFDNLSSKYKFFIDMITVADSIDAATDSVGRGYASSHSFTRVLGEIRDQAGTRYSPVIAQALEDEDLVARIRQVITQGRKDAYYTAYLDLFTQATGEEDQT